MADSPKNVSAREFLGPVADRLNRSSDLLNDSIAKIQADLRTLNLGLEVWVPIPGTRDYEPDSQYVTEYQEAELGFAEHENEWALMVRRVHHTDNNAFGQDVPLETYDEERPLLRASRHLRIEAVSAVGDLLVALKEEAERILRIVDEAEEFAGNLRL